MVHSALDGGEKDVNLSSSFSPKGPYSQSRSALIALLFAYQREEEGYISYLVGRSSKLVRQQLYEDKVIEHLLG